jgi:hypothetical protein
MPVLRVPSPNDRIWLFADLLTGGRTRLLSPRKRTSELTAAAHNDLFVGNVSFAIRKQTFASSFMNGNLGSIPAFKLAEF